MRISPKHVSKSYFYWEFVVFTEKVILTILAARFEQDLKGVQLVFAMICLCIFLAIQMHNEPYFTARLNRFHNLAIIAQLWYCACRAIMMGLVQINMGGQVDPHVEKNIALPEELFEYTRGYVDIESESIELAIQTVFFVNLIIISAVMFHFLQIMYQHFLFYLVMMQDLESKLKNLTVKEDDKRAEAETSFTANQLAQIKANHKEEDRCSCCRWNHAGCLRVFLCKCKKTNDHVYEDFKAGPFAQFMHEVGKSCDSDYERDMVEEEEAR